MPLLINTSDLGDRCVQLTLSGEVDCATAPELREAINEVLRNQNPVTVYVDIADVTVLDSMGIRTLVAAYKIAHDVCVRLVVVNPNVFFMRLFRVLGVANLLGVSAEQDEDGDALALPVQRNIRIMR